MTDEAMVAERMVAVPGRFDRSPTLGQLAKAKAQAQAKFLPLGKDKTANAGKYSYSYADLATCLDAVVPALSEFGLALFQPTRIEAGQAIATSLLVHESGEFISGDFAVAIVDPTDAQSIGSATSYARRYGGLALLAYAAGDDDDDGQAARGGDHEMAKTTNAPACPACGVVGSIMKGAPQYGGGILCWARRGGCGVKWPEGTPFPPTEKPPINPDPPKGRAKKEATKPKAEVVAVGSAEKIQAFLDKAEAHLDAMPGGAQGATVVGTEDCPEEGCWGSRGHEGPHVFEPAQPAAPVAEVAKQPETFPSGVPPAASAPAAAVTSGKTTFTLFGKVYETAGMTSDQMSQSYDLATAVDKGPLGKGYARRLLAKLLHVPVEQVTRNSLTEAMATKYLAALKQAAASGEEVTP